MVSVIEAVILGIVQGITEWFPVSSSGHLVIFQELFSIDTSVFYDMVLHLGTLLVILFYYKTQILNILKAIIRFDFKSEYGLLAKFILIGSIPLGLFGFFMVRYIKDIFSNLILVGVSLFFTGIILHYTKKKKGKTDLNQKNTFIIGLVQCLALFPGVSRSGITIGMGIIQGVDRELAAMYSFLLSIPAIIGANIFLFLKEPIITENLGVSLIGLFTSAVVGYITLKTLIKLIKKNHFHKFSLYCIIIGVIIFIRGLIQQ